MSKGGTSMPRPVRCRRIGQMPAFRSFSPDDAPDAEVICLTLDEYETLRLMDAKGLKQEACAAQMNVARTTVTAIYESARHKIATALVQGKRLQITGGCCEFAPVPPPEQPRSMKAPGIKSPRHWSGGKGCRSPADAASSRRFRLPNT